MMENTYKDKLEELAYEYENVTQEMAALQGEYKKLDVRRIELQGAIKMLNDMITESNLLAKCDTPVVEKESDKDDTQS